MCRDPRFHNPGLLAVIRVPHLQECVKHGVTVDELLELVEAFHNSGDSQLIFELQMRKPNMSHDQHKALVNLVMDVAVYIASAIPEFKDQEPMPVIELSPTYGDDITVRYWN